MRASRDESGISDAAVQVYFWVMFAVLCQMINVFGIASNIINIICFAKQGFADSVNISLLGLAVSDLGSLITMVWTCICVTPAFLSADLPFEPMDVAYLVSSIPHLAFTRVSACLTAMITLERCLCITAPLKIKSRITPKRACVITVCIFVIFIFSGTPVYAASTLGWKYSPLRNTTIVGIIKTKYQEQVDFISFAINAFSIPICAFVIIVVCTIIISVKLRTHSKWRQETKSSSLDDRISNRNRKAASMVVMISTLFIVCFIPVSVFLFAGGLIPDLLLHGKYMNIAAIIVGLGNAMESFNSSMNIFIYFKMSSVYRDTFLKIIWTVSSSRKSKLVHQIR